MSRHDKKSKNSKDVKFIELKISPPSHNLKVEIGAVNILIDGSTDLELFARLIKMKRTKRLRL